MGSVYRRKVRVCTTCDRRLDTTAARRACETAGHVIRIRSQGPWWIRYTVDGRRQCVSAASDKKADAIRLLRGREDEAPVPVSITADVGTMTFDEAAEDLLTDYRINQKRSLRTITLRIQKHLTPFFGGRRMGAITTGIVRQYIVQRQTAGASNAAINRDLIALKRTFSLAIQAGLLTTRPYLPLLAEQHVRTGFFERDELDRMTQHLPASMRGIAAFAFITGWRTPSEILPFEWRQVDLVAGEVRLDPGFTKNGDGRVFPITRELRHVLDGQQRIAAQLQRERGLIPRYVFCFITGKKAGQRMSESAFLHQWWRARVLAGCPGRIPHDFRRTAVRNLVRAGVPERVAMQLTGHKTGAVFERYNITSPNDLRDAARRLDAYASGTLDA